jgi:hypothetical protein
MLPDEHRIQRFSKPRAQTANADIPGDVSLQIVSSQPERSEGRRDGITGMIAQQKERRRSRGVDEANRRRFFRRKQRLARMVVHATDVRCLS